jgi:ferredoxin-thioredoxin reductase catalytic subunit
MEKIEVSDKEVDEAYLKLKEETEKRGYFLNFDVSFTKNLIRGLLRNEKRYGYWACPCRLASGKREEDLDIICPCDYRDPDLNEYGCCYCSLYLSQENLKNKTYKAIPERRKKGKPSSASLDAENSKNATEANNYVNGGKTKMETDNENKIPVWRCKVCGYLCARDSPPEKCPICGVTQDRFERFE